MPKNTELERLVSKQQLIKASRLREKEIAIEGIGVVRIRELTTAQRLKYLEYLEIGDDGKPHFPQVKQVEFNKFVIAIGVINGDSTKNDEQGDLMFPDGDVPDMRMDVAENITKEILILSGILPTPEAKKTLPNGTTSEPPISGKTLP